MGEFGFATFAEGMRTEGEKFGLLQLQPRDGSGDTMTALNSLLSKYNDAYGSLGTAMSEAAEICDAQNDADVTFAKAPTPHDIQDMNDRAEKLSGSARDDAMKDAADAKLEAARARKRHADDTNPNDIKLKSFTVPTGTWASADTGHTNNPVTNLPATDPTMSVPSSPISDTSPVGGTHLSSDMDGLSDSAARPMMSQQPPAMPPMQPQAQGQGATPGAGGGAMPGFGGSGALTPPRRDRDKDKNSDLATDLSGAEAGAATAGAAGLTSTVDRGQTVTGAHTKADISGMNQQSVQAGKGGAPPAGGVQGGGAMRGMGAMPLGSGAGGMGSSGAKKSDLGPAAHQDRKQVGHDTVSEAVEGGIISRTTTSEPEFPYREIEEELKPGKPQNRWDSQRGKWIKPVNEEDWK